MSTSVVFGSEIRKICDTVSNYRNECNTSMRKKDIHG